MPKEVIIDGEWYLGKPVAGIEMDMNVLGFGFNRSSRTEALRIASALPNKSVAELLENAEKIMKYLNN